MTEGFKLPRVRAADSITDKAGKAATAFVRFWDTVMKALEMQERNQNGTIAEIQALVVQLQAVAQQAQSAQRAANDAQQTADGTGATSAYASVNVTLNSSVWVSGPLVNLTSVVAGNLTISGTGPQQTDAVQMAGAADSISGEFRIVEIVGGVDSTLFTGLFNVSRASFEASEPAVVVNRSVSDVSAFALSRSSTGSVSYRLDARRTSGSAIVSDLNLYLFARRA